MDALRQSLDRVSTGKKKAAKAEIEKPVKAAGEGGPRRSARRADDQLCARYCSKIWSRTHCADDPGPQLIFRRAGPWPPWMSMRQWPGLAVGRDGQHDAEHTELLQRGARDAFYVLLIHVVPAAVDPKMEEVGDSASHAAVASTWAAPRRTLGRLLE